MRFHVHPSIAQHASGAASQKSLQLPFEALERVRSELLKDAESLYIPTRRVTKKHPLSGDDKRNRFITPRKTANLHLL